ncbi:MAG: ABC transporter ATP-binding protein [Burkholderiaceae bacterium]
MATAFQPPTLAHPPAQASATIPRPPAAAAEPVIRAQGLTKKFANQEAVVDLNFEIPRGIIFGMIGPSGSGKTTTVRLMTGIYHPTAGSIEVMGQSPQKFSASLRRKLGYMPQQFVLYPDLSVWENLNFSASLYGMGFGPDRTRRIKELLAFVELDEHHHKLARNLSGGMQRRMALAATLAHDPELLFLDEPTAGIDPILRQKFWDYFRMLRSRGTTLIITTQYVGEAANCDLVGVMAEGKLLMVESPDRLRRRAFGGEIVDLQMAKPLDFNAVAEIRRLPFVTGPVRILGDSNLRMVVDDAGTAVAALATWAAEGQREISSVEPVVIPLDDVFVELVKGQSSRD